MGVRGQAGGARREGSGGACLCALRWLVVLDVAAVAHVHFRLAMVRAAQVAAVLLCALCVCVHAWTQAELDMYDLAEDVKGSFYDLLGVDKVGPRALSPRACCEGRLSLQLPHSRARLPPRSARPFAKCPSYCTRTSPTIPMQTASSVSW